MRKNFPLRKFLTLNILASSVLLFTLSFSSITYAEELIEYAPSVRALGMGNAFSMHVDDCDSLFYNPAGLARNSLYAWRIIDLAGGLDGSDIYNRVQDAKDKTGIDAFQDFYGTNVWTGLSGKTALIIPGFSFAFYDTGNLAFRFNDPAYPTFNLGVVNDVGYALGFAGSLFPGFYVGVDGKRITRTGKISPVGLDALTSEGGETVTNALNSKGVGYAADFGLQYVAPIPSKPSLSFVWKNIGYTKFIAEEGVEAPPMIRDEMVAGFGMDIDLLVMNIRPAIDYKHINWHDEPLGKKIHLGIEFDLPLISLRAGFNQGYYTYGATVDLWFIRFELASYGVELGEYPGQHEDRRYMAQAIIEVGFDPGTFSFSGWTNSKPGGKRLKQRR